MSSIQRESSQRTWFCSDCPTGVVKGEQEDARGTGESAFLFPYPLLWGRSWNQFLPKNTGWIVVIWLFVQRRLHTETLRNGCGKRCWLTEVHAVGEKAMIRCEWQHYITVPGFQARGSWESKTDEKTRADAGLNSLIHLNCCIRRNIFKATNSLL